jgi:hypothetical protein
MVRPNQALVKGVSMDNLRLKQVPIAKAGMLIRS